MKPVAAYTIDHTGCQHVSTDCAAIERIAEAGSNGRTEVVYLVTLSVAYASIEEMDKRIAELEAELSEMTGRAERQWAGWVEAEALLKEAGPLMRDFSLIAEMEKNAPPMESVFVNVDLLRAARSIAAKIGGLPK